MRRFLRNLGRLIWRFMVIFSFIVNLVLVIVLIGAGILIFEIKNNIADPLVGGLHSTAIGLENATIDWTIPVRDNIPVDLDIQLNTDTIVVLSEPVPLSVVASIDLPGINAYNVAANVDLSLPAGLELPVTLDVPVPVRERMDVELDVRAVIPLSETQLADPIQTLGLLFEPLALGLHNLPSDFDAAGHAVAQILRGEKAIQDFNLLASDGTGGINDRSYEAWAGYSRTAGLNYNMLGEWVPEDNRTELTGIVPPGGIPILDSQLPGRAEIYAQYEDSDVPLYQVIDTYNQQQVDALAVDENTYDGGMAQFYLDLQALATPPPTQQLPEGENIIGEGQPGNIGGQNADDFGIVPTPEPPPQSP